MTATSSGRRSWLVSEHIALALIDSGDDLCTRANANVMLIPHFEALPRAFAALFEPPSNCRLRSADRSDTWATSARLRDIIWRLELTAAQAVWTAVVAELVDALP